MASPLLRPPNMQHMPGTSRATASCLQAYDTQVSHSKVNCSHVWKNGRDRGWRARWCSDSHHVSQAGLEASGTVSKNAGDTYRARSAPSLTTRVLAGVRAGQRSVPAAFPAGQQGLPAEPHLASAQRSEASPSEHRPHHCKTRKASW